MLQQSMARLRRRRVDGTSDVWYFAFLTLSSLQEVSYGLDSGLRLKYARRGMEIRVVEIFGKIFKD